jgi:hypothetical protein
VDVSGGGGGGPQGTGLASTGGSVPIGTLGSQGVGKVIVTPVQCGGSITTASATPVWALPLTKDAVDLVSQTSFAQPGQSPSFESPGGVRGNALYLYSSNFQLTATVVSSANAFSYCLWFYTLGSPGTGLPNVLLGTSDGFTGAGTFCLGSNLAGQIYFGRGNTSGACYCPANLCQAFAVYNAPVFTGNVYLQTPGNQAVWSHVCVTYGGGVGTIFVNGSLVSISDVAFDNLPVGRFLTLGAHGQGPGTETTSTMKAAVQCVAAWDEQLSPDQVASLYHNQNGTQGCATLASFSQFACKAQMTAFATPVFLTGATQMTPLPTVTKPVRKSSSFGRTFYISQTTGNDANSGLSPSAAWQTPTQISRWGFNGGYVFASQIYPGDTFLFCNGDVWFNTYIVLGFSNNSFGTASMPITFGNYSCNNQKTNPPFMSQGGILPQTTGVIGWWRASSWVFANGSQASASGSQVFAYDLGYLNTIAGQQFINGADAQVYNNPGNFEVEMWIGGLEYRSATHPNFLDPSVRTGRALQEFLWYDEIYQITSSSSQYMGIAGGSYCASLFHGLYGGNTNAWQAGAGGVTNWYSGANGVFPALLISPRFMDEGSISGQPLTAWLPAQYSCADWYQSYVISPGYTYSALDPWTYMIPYAQNAADSHYNNAQWTPARFAPDSFFGGVNDPFPAPYPGSPLRAWGLGFQLTRHRDFLDSPGEYWYDPSSGILYIMPYPDHVSALLTNRTTSQTPFTLAAQGPLAYTGQIATVFNTAGAQQGCISTLGTTNGSTTTGNQAFVVVHDFEFAYSSFGVGLNGLAGGELYNLNIHDMQGGGILATSSTAATGAHPNLFQPGALFIYNNNITNIPSCIAVGQGLPGPSNGVFVYDNLCTNMGVTFGEGGTGISINGPRIPDASRIRGNIINNVAGCSNGNGGIFGPTPGTTIEFNKIGNATLSYLDQGASFYTGNWYFNEVVNATVNTLFGFIDMGVHGVWNADFLYAESGVDHGTWHGNYYSNGPSVCLNVGGYSTNTFTNNLCVNTAQLGDNNPLAVDAEHYFHGYYSSNPEDIAKYDSNWSFWTDVFYSEQVFPTQSPYVNTHMVGFFPGVQQYGDIVNLDAVTTTYGTLYFTQQVYFPLYFRSLFCNGLIEGYAGGAFTLTQEIIDTFGYDPTILQALSNSAWFTEQVFAFSTDNYAAGIQYGQANCKTILANALLDLRANASAARAASEQAAWNQAYGLLLWYP